MTLKERKKRKRRETNMKLIMTSLSPMATSRMMRASLTKRKRKRMDRRRWGLNVMIFKVGNIMP